jgi:hypothetical protein
VATAKATLPVKAHGNEGTHYIQHTKHNRQRCRDAHVPHYLRTLLGTPTREQVAHAMPPLHEPISPVREILPQ